MQVQKHLKKTVFTDETAFQLFNNTISHFFGQCDEFQKIVEKSLPGVGSRSKERHRSFALETLWMPRSIFQFCRNIFLRYRKQWEVNGR